MAPATEWTLRIDRESLGELHIALYEFDEHGQGSLVDVETFGPFDTATDVSAWFVRHWAPRARLPMR